VGVVVSLSPNGVESFKKDFFLSTSSSDAVINCGSGVVVVVVVVVEVEVDK